MIFSMTLHNRQLHEHNMRPETKFRQTKDNEFYKENIEAKTYEEALEIAEMHRVALNFVNVGWKVLSVKGIYYVDEC